MMIEVKLDPKVNLISLTFIWILVVKEAQACTGGCGIGLPPPPPLGCPPGIGIGCAAARAAGRPTYAGTQNAYPQQREHPNYNPNQAYDVAQYDDSSQYQPQQQIYPGVYAQPQRQQSLGCGVLAGLRTASDTNVDEANALLVLGGTLSVEPLRGGSFSTTVAISEDLNCFALESPAQCRWRNAAATDSLDHFDWGIGNGQADRLRWKLLTGSDDLPVAPFLLTGSRHRLAADRAVLLSDPIGCQRSDGTLSFRYWPSRSRKEGERPKVSVCWKFASVVGAMEDCSALGEVSNGMQNAQITITGPITRPFQLAIVADNFVNSPEGGFVALDSLRYRASVSQSCPDQPIGVGAGRIITATGSGFSGNTGPLPPRSSDGLQSLDPLQPSKDLAVNLQPESAIDVDSCRSVACDFKESASFCRLQPKGRGSKARGRSAGWKIVAAMDNPTNPLTGVRFDTENTQEGPFAVASFPDPRQEEQQPDLQFSLESDPLTFTESHYLSFHRYVATAGTLLMVCRDPNGDDCLWSSPPLLRGYSKAQQNRAWSSELIRLPRGQYRLYLLARYDGNNSINAGQIGLAYLKLYRDADLRFPLC